MISSSESRLILTQFHRADRSRTDGSGLFLDRERESGLTVCESDDIRSGDDDSSRESAYLVYEDGTLDQVAALALCLYRDHRVCRIVDSRSVWYRYPQQRYTRYHRMIYGVYSLCGPIARRTACGDHGDDALWSSRIYHRLDRLLYRPVDRK